MKLNPKHIWLLNEMAQGNAVKTHLVTEDLNCSTTCVTDHLRDLHNAGLIYIKPHQKVDRFVVLPAGHEALSKANVPLAIANAKLRTYQRRAFAPKPPPAEMELGCLHADIAFLAAYIPQRQTAAEDLAAVAYGRLPLSDQLVPATRTEFQYCRATWAALPDHRKKGDAKRAWDRICAVFEK